MVLAASIRNLEHLLFAIKIVCPLVTVPLRVITEWVDRKPAILPDDFVYQPKTLKPIPFKEIPLNKGQEEYNIQHALTDKGIKKFCEDWNSVFLSSFLGK